MNAIEISRKLIDKSPNWSQNRVGMELGLTSQTMSARMLREDIKAGFFASILNVLGYDLVAVPKGSRLPNGSVKVDAK